MQRLEEKEEGDDEVVAECSGEGIVGGGDGGW